MGFQWDLNGSLMGFQGDYAILDMDFPYFDAGSHGSKTADLAMCCWKNSRVTGDVFAEPPPCPAAVSAETIKDWKKIEGRLLEVLWRCFLYINL